MRAGLCHAGFDSYYSWGGRAQLGDDGRWHLYASFMCKHNSLSKWTTVSSSGHFVGTSPVGPFEFSTEQCDGEVCTPVIIPWSHNTVPLRYDNATAGDKWQIWHIGDGIVPAKEFSPCFNKSEVGVAIAPNASTAGAADLRADPGAEVFIATAATPRGPW